MTTLVLLLVFSISPIQRIGHLILNTTGATTTLESGIDVGQGINVAPI